MQLQGELEAQRKELRENSGVLARDEMERLERENVRLKSELAEARKDHLKAQKLAEGYKGECQSLVRDYQTAGEQIKTMEGQIRSLEEERDHYRRQADMSQRELAIQADRIKALEAQLQPMNLQVGWRAMGWPYHWLCVVHGTYYRPSPDPFSPLQQAEYTYWRSNSYK